MTGSPVSRRPLFLVVAAALLAAVGCSEDLATNTTCPELCPEQDLDVLTAVLTPVVEDTTIAGFPLRGTEARLLVARAGDTLDARVVYRFDSLPRTFTRGTATEAITEVVEPVLEVLVFRRDESLVPAGTTVQAFDVDVAGDDTSTAVLSAAFTPARLLGSGTLAPRAAGDTTSIDTLRVALDPAKLLAKIQGDTVLRVGLRLAAGAEARLRLSPTAAQISFRPSTDASIAVVRQGPESRTPADNRQLQIDLSSFTVVTRGTPPPTDPVLTIGGLPARRSHLRFAIPREHEGVARISGETA